MADPKSKRISGLGTRLWAPFPIFLGLDSLNLCLGLFKNAYTYLPAPPLVPATAALASSIVKDWGTSPSESEKFSTADLDPFESMLPWSLHSCAPVGDATFPKERSDRRSSRGSSSPSRPPTKRVRVEIDTGPLDELIPPVLDDPSRDVLYAYDDPPSPITFLPLSSHGIPHCPLNPLHLMFTPLSHRSRHKQRLPSRHSCRLYMPALPG